MDKFENLGNIVLNNKELAIKILNTKNFDSLYDIVYTLDASISKEELKEFIKNIALLDKEILDSTLSEIINNYGGKNILNDENLESVSGRGNITKKVTIGMLSALTALSPIMGMTGSVKGVSHEGANSGSYFSQPLYDGAKLTKGGALGIGAAIISGIEVGTRLVLGLVYNHKHKEQEQELKSYIDQNLSKLSGKFKKLCELCYSLQEKYNDDVALVFCNIPNAGETWNHLYNVWKNHKLELDSIENNADFRGAIRFIESTTKKFSKDELVTYIYNSIEKVILNFAKDKYKKYKEQDDLYNDLKIENLLEEHNLYEDLKSSKSVLLSEIKKEMQSKIVIPKREEMSDYNAYWSLANYCFREDMVDEFIKIFNIKYNIYPEEVINKNKNELLNCIKKDLDNKVDLNGEIIQLAAKIYNIDKSGNRTKNEYGSICHSLFFLKSGTYEEYFKNRISGIWDAIWVQNVTNYSQRDKFYNKISQYDNKSKELLGQLINILDTQIMHKSEQVSQQKKN